MVGVIIGLQNEHLPKFLGRSLMILVLLNTACAPVRFDWNAAFQTTPIF